MMGPTFGNLPQHSDNFFWTQTILVVAMVFTAIFNNHCMHVLDRAGYLCMPCNLGTRAQYLRLLIWKFKSAQETRVTLCNM